MNVACTGAFKLGTYKAYDMLDIVQALEERNVTPHVAIKRIIRRHSVPRRTGVDRRIIRDAGYAIRLSARPNPPEVSASSGSVGEGDSCIHSLAADDLIRTSCRPRRERFLASGCRAMEPTFSTCWAGLRTAGTSTVEFAFGCRTGVDPWHRR